MNYKIDHIALYAHDIKGLAKFYRDIFDFTESNIVSHDDGSIKMIRLSMNKYQSLEFFNFDSKSKKSAGYVNSGYMHMGFYTDDIDSIITKLKNSGCEIIGDKYLGGDGKQHFFVRDNEGNEVELTQNQEVQE